MDQSNKTEQEIKLGLKKEGLEDQGFISLGKINI
jgi:hypothetical protein